MARRIGNTILVTWALIVHIVWRRAKRDPKQCVYSKKSNQILQMNKMIKVFHLCRLDLPDFIDGTCEKKDSEQIALI